MTLVNQRADVPVTIDESLCIEGCTLCVDICPLDSLAINPDNGRAYMHVDVLPRDVGQPGEGRDLADRRVLPVVIVGVQPAR
jgi:Fe-S-cluster-containing hydrogenase component 2